MFHLFEFGLLYLVAITASATAATDKTLEEDAFGKDVTEAVLRKLSLSKIFPEDYNFLIRVAYFETRFGENRNSSLPFQGGIWAVNESFYEATKYPNLSTEHALIAQKFQINWNNTQWMDLRKPIHSGIAVALYLNFVLGVAIPQHPGYQADYWHTNYRPMGNKLEFATDVGELREKMKCRERFNLCIVLDSSNSIQQTDYFLWRNFIGDMMESFSLNFTRVGMLIYSNRTEFIFRVKNPYSTSQMATLAKRAPYHQGNTYTGNGILEAVELLKETDDSNDIPQIIFVFTNGKSDGGQESLAESIELMKNNSIKPFSIGIGTEINETELSLIAMNDSTSVFMLDRFFALQSILQQLTTVTCEFPHPAKLDEAYNDLLIANEKRIYKIEPPPEGITFTIDVPEGDTKGFWSHWNPVPSEALNDGIINGPTYIPAPPGIVGKRQNEGVEEELFRNIYITIQGVEPINNYTLTMTYGNEEQPSCTLITTITNTTIKNGTIINSTTNATISNGSC